MPKRRVLTLLLSVIAVACKPMADPVSKTVASETRPPQCSERSAFRGTCQVADLSPRQGTTPASLRGTTIAEITEIRIAVPARGSSENVSQMRFARREGILDDWFVDQALDLYSRSGCVAEVTGGVFGERYTPRVTVRLLMNIADEGRTAFAEISDYRSGKPLHATLGLKCEWQL